MSEQIPSIMPSNSSMQNYTFLDHLRDALEGIGIPSERDFKVPGTGHRVDLYLPRLPRASIEFKSLATSSNIEDCIRQVERTHAALRAEMGSAFRSIILMITKHGIEPKQLTGHSDGIAVIAIETSSSPEETANSAALAIQKLLDTDRKTNLGLKIGTASVGLAVLGSLGVGGAGVGLTVGAALAGGVVGLLPPIGLIAGGAWAVKRFLDSKDNAPADVDPPQEESPGEPARELGYAPVLATPPSEEIVRCVAAQATSIMETFRELAPEAHPVLVHEMAFLVEEFRQGHFTACALRAGRSLEFMVYELSRRWGIEIQDAAFGMLQELRARLDRVGDLVGDYQTSESEQRKKLEADLNSCLVDLSQKTMALALAIKEQRPAKEPKDDLGPRTVPTLLKKIRKRYGHLDGVALDLNALIDKDADTPSGSLVGRVLRIRNRAAHADVNGQHRETEEASVKALLDDLNVVMLKLSNVGIAIHRNRAKC